MFLKIHFTRQISNRDWLLMLSYCEFTRQLLLGKKSPNLNTLAPNTFLLPTLATTAREVVLSLATLRYV